MLAHVLSGRLPVVGSFADLACVFWNCLVSRNLKAVTATTSLKMCGPKGPEKFAYFDSCSFRHIVIMMFL